MYSLVSWICYPIIGAVRLLGEPIKETGFDVNDIEKNHWDENRAAFEVTVSGPKDKGKFEIINKQLLWVL